jgi:hypothetical protein
MFLKFHFETNKIAISININIEIDNAIYFDYRNISIYFSHSPVNKKDPC